MMTMVVMTMKRLATCLPTYGQLIEAVHQYLHRHGHQNQCSHRRLHHSACCSQSVTNLYRFIGIAHNSFDSSYSGGCFYESQLLSLPLPLASTDRLPGDQSRQRYVPATRRAQLQPNVQRAANTHSEFEVGPGRVRRPHS